MAVVLFKRNLRRNRADKISAFLSAALALFRDQKDF